MNAMATLYRFNAIIHQCDYPSMAQVFHDPMGSVPTVHVSFHLGEHYNSVRRADDSQALGRAPVEFYPIGHNLEAVKNIVG